MIGLGVEQPAGRTTGAIGLRVCFSAVDCSSTDRSGGWSRSTTSRRVKDGSQLASARAHPARTVVPYSQREHPMCHGCAPRRPPSFPVSEISWHFNGETACAIRCTGRTPVRDGVTSSDRPLPESAMGGAALAALAWFGSRSMLRMAARSAWLRSLTKGAASLRLVSSRRHDEPARPPVNGYTRGSSACRKGA